MNNLQTKLVRERTCEFTAFLINNTLKLNDFFLVANAGNKENIDRNIFEKLPYYLEMIELIRKLVVFIDYFKRRKYKTLDDLDPAIMRKYFNKNASRSKDQNDCIPCISWDGDIGLKRARIVVAAVS